MLGTWGAHASFTPMALMSLSYFLLKGDTLEEALRADLGYGLEKHLDTDTDKHC